MRKPVDLHCHSNYSDGSCSVQEIVKIACEKGLDALALTDHDTLNGIPEAMLAAAGTDLELIPGIEFSTAYQEIEIHIVGLYIDYDDPSCKKELQSFADSRDGRNRVMCEKLRAAGIPISYDEIIAANPGSVITRAHFGKFMLQHGYVASISEAFEKYIGEDAPCFVKRKKITPQDAIRFIKKYHGISILAHPFQYKLGDEGLENLVSILKSEGLEGIEAYYCTHTPEMTEQIISLAGRYGLLLSGGSDFHGTHKPGLEIGTGYGNLHVPGEALIQLKRRLSGVNENTKIFFSDFDGTLGSSAKTITPATRKALNDFVERGNIFVLSSGRPTPDGLRIARQAGLDYPGMYLSSFNGSEVYSFDRQKSCYRETLALEDVRKLFEMVTEAGIYIHTYDHNKIVTRAFTKETAYYTRSVLLDVRTEEDPAGSLSEAPCKCISIELDHPEKLIPLSHKIDETFAGRIYTVFSNPNYMEIISVKASKGNALRYLARHLGIDIANTIAAGDAMNDLSMIEAAGTGVVMCNGLKTAPALAEYADIITENDNDHDGLVPILEKS